MISSFRNAATQDIYNGVDSKGARKTLPTNLVAKARIQLDRIAFVVSVGALRVPPGNNLEKLKGNRAGQYSIRINEQFRICFTFDGGNAEQVEICDYH